jgi:hypothetical protein
MLLTTLLHLNLLLSVFLHLCITAACHAFTTQIE